MSRLLAGSGRILVVAWVSDLGCLLPFPRVFNGCRVITELICSSQSCFVEIHSTTLKPYMIEPCSDEP